jgi:hypothetical protein
VPDPAVTHLGSDPKPPFWRVRCQTLRPAFLTGRAERRRPSRQPRGLEADGSPSSSGRPVLSERSSFRPRRDEEVTLIRSATRNDAGMDDEIRSGPRDPVRNAGQPSSRARRGTGRRPVVTRTPGMLSRSRLASGAGRAASTRRTRGSRPCSPSRASLPSTTATSSRRPPSAGWLAVTRREPARRSRRPGPSSPATPGSRRRTRSASPGSRGSEAGPAERRDRAPARRTPAPGAHGWCPPGTSRAPSAAIRRAGSPSRRASRGITGRRRGLPGSSTAGPSPAGSLRRGIMDG